MYYVKMLALSGMFFQTLIPWWNKSEKFWILNSPSKDSQQTSTQCCLIQCCLGPTMYRDTYLILAFKLAEWASNLVNLEVCILNCADIFHFFFYFLLKIFFSHTAYPNHSFPFLYSFQFLLTSPPILIHSLSVMRKDRLQRDNNQTWWNNL